MLLGVLSIILEIAILVGSETTACHERTSAVSNLTIDLNEVWLTVEHPWEGAV